jgi:hypothetical protein
MPEHGFAISRLVALLASLTLAAAAAACGDSEEEDPVAETGSVQEDRAAPADDKQRVAAVVEGMYRDLAAGDAAGVCAAMSDAARAQIARQAPGGAGEHEGERSCEASMTKFMDVAEQSGVLERTAGAQARRVAIDGAVATVTVSVGGTLGKIRLQRVGDDWRLGVGAVAGGA